MGQRAGNSQLISEPLVQPLAVSIFKTDLGWMGLVGSSQGVALLEIGHRQAGQVREALARRLPELFPETAWDEADCLPDLRADLIAYAQGERVDFAGVSLDLPPKTVFQQRVIEALCEVKFGTTVSYGELAERAGFPQAARAVGSVMSSNRIPIIIPCHRVLASQGKLGGYSAPQGITLKQRLLDLERAAK